MRIKTGIVYIFEFGRGFKWMAEIFLPNVQRKHGLILVGKPFYKSIYSISSAIDRNMRQVGISNFQVARIEGLTSPPQFMETLKKYTMED